MIAEGALDGAEATGAGQFGPNPATNPNFTHLGTGPATVPDGHGGTLNLEGAHGHSEYPRQGSNNLPAPLVTTSPPSSPAWAPTQSVVTESDEEIPLPRPLRTYSRRICRDRTNSNRMPRVPALPTDPPTEAAKALEELKSLPSFEDTKEQVQAAMNDITSAATNIIPSITWETPHEGSSENCQRQPYEQADARAYFLPDEVAVRVPVSESQWAQILQAAKEAAAKIGATNVQVMQNQPGIMTCGSPALPEYSSKSGIEATLLSPATPGAAYRETKGRIQAALI
ncbi:putative lipoprotein [Mycobacterium xenopi 4042]|uniref:Putative lipoprotein n=1 Tax=Mycobacterium xenopi 4042 TaxID=1299334 RepID=X8AQS1_MYCXE|nr:putative lipoprotein [Mycobacterium xenopi 4042]